ncbi:MAG TPA: peptide-binding protein [Elusimicrobia bacterium]|nr:MAG: peptide-binding protein [Elusimicrobia bacterium RIFOXYA12_FULL_49_49]OGS10045.1 MAG: peptide-binding protein [Elusimicrobia bacterium RIFOXYA1_FULL_47_7]OGS10591.1 MAG: peptide-binding protein [Elusimicrobia bacterium RIFOXYB1_FULL_48_9]OGS16061.1 MAG: peptide-binding protein [Elusimicrobia bacterium RIFOXYA2_FULL_47_53]OGS26687.1 MAG: peptide-binding protein [Elusimicrobia bacterium RIFOXYB12_FULL_50_12]OGS30187.1 MAG: peptide-binding protein [Elusimicrobia bacterium RIFOXYB2_FULL_46
MKRILPAVFALLFFTSCGDGIKKTAAPDSAEPSYGDYFVTSSIGDASYLNPILATDNASGSINGLIFNGLVKYDKNLKITADLADSWEISDNGLAVTFHLRKNVLWHDGAPFTSDDVKFTYERLIDPEVKTPFGSDYALIKKLETPDKHTVKVTYKETFAPALESWMMGIVPRHIFQGSDFNSSPANRRPVGTGPFVFKEWKTDEKIVLESNKNYFEGRPYIDRYIFRIIPDQSVEFLELRNRSIDEMSLTPDQWNAYKEFFSAYNKFRYPAFQYVYMGFNLYNPFFSDIRVRRALAHALNKNEIINGVLLGMGKPATGPFPPQSWAYNSEVKDFEYSPEKAREILFSLGWRTEKDGYLHKDGKVFEFTIMTNQGNKIRSLSAEIIQSQLKAVGIKANIRIIEWSSFIHQFIDKHNFDAVILGWNLSRDPDQFAIWNSAQTKEGQYNFVGYSNPEVDRLLENGRRVFDLKKRERIYREIHAKIFNDIPYIFLYYPEALPVVHKRFKNVEAAPAGIGWNFHKWWVPANEQKYMLTR